ncbi:MAG: PH domain-containing protein [Patescibacteria group bacterium]|jgi:uncharacterized membrane protein YdbT with pleckstrin-like domain
MPPNPQVITTTRATAVPMLSSETEIFRVHKSYFFLIAPIIFVSLVGIALIIAINVLSNQIPTNLINYLRIGIIAMIVFIDALIWFDWLTTIYTLTNRRIQYRFGVIGEQTKTIALDQITDNKVVIGIFGRIFNYGDVVIDAAHINSTISFKGIGSAESRKDQIDNAKG